MNREPIQSPARSVANVEFHRTEDHTNDVARRIVAVLERQGIRAMNPAMGFPMEMDRFLEKSGWSRTSRSPWQPDWGKWASTRNVIHPKFGNFILLGTIVLDRAINRPMTGPSPTILASNANSA
ncbi:MAG: hypothetical protein U0231_03125 [Nitrospiraceae bacterium]